MTTTQSPQHRTELVRTRGGDMIHHHTCRHNRWNSATPWEWAQGREVVQVKMAATRFRLKECRVCKPLDGSALRIIGQEISV